LPSRNKWLKFSDYTPPQVNGENNLNIAHKYVPPRKGKRHGLPYKNCFIDEQCFKNSNSQVMIGLNTVKKIISKKQTKFTINLHKTTSNKLTRFSIHFYKINNTLKT